MQPKQMKQLKRLIKEEAPEEDNPDYPGAKTYDVAVANVGVVSSGRGRLVSLRIFRSYSQRGDHVALFENGELISEANISD